MILNDCDDRIIYQNGFIWFWMTVMIELQNYMGFYDFEDKIILKLFGINDEDINMF